MDYIANNPSLKKFRKKLRKNQTDTENFLWQRLRNKQLNGLKFFRQYSLGPYILDFYCPKKHLAIELDGGQHLERKEYDDRRSDYLRENGIQVIRFWDHEVLQDIETIMEVIWEKLKGNNHENNSP